MADTPFCASSPEAAAMDDGEFWETIEAQRHGMTVEEMRARDFDPAVEWENYDPTPDEIERYQFDNNPCPLCGSLEACGSDDEGRPMIHVIPEDFDG